MDFTELSDNILRSVVAAVAEEIIEKLEEIPGNVAENLSYDSGYNKTKLSDDELIKAQREIANGMISTIRSHFVAD